jgi:flavorubredoxin
MTTTYKAAPDIDVLATTHQIPGLGDIAINAFLLHGSAPLLVETGAVVDREEFMTALRSVIDPKDLRWIWLTHTDPDHTGALRQLMDENGEINVITTFLGVGAMSLSDPLPMDRVYLVNPGQTMTIGERTLTAIKPPTFDNPCTTGFYDHASGALFSSDCFGALLPEVPEDAAELTEEVLRQGQILWASIDSPWLHAVDTRVLEKQLDEIRRIEPKLILSDHLPAAGGAMIKLLLSSIAGVPVAQPFVGPDQAALIQMMTQAMEGAPA